MKESINNQHMLCEDWKRELQFFKEELPILKNRLGEVASKNTDKTIMAQVEQFENKFHIMSVHIDELLHDVNLKAASLSSKAMTQANYIHVRMVETDANLEDLMQTTSTEFYALKKQYYNFLSKVM